MKMRIFSIWATVFLLLVTILAGGAVAQEAMPKNIILMIGDGMGFPQLTLGRLAKGSLGIEECPVGGAMTTHPLPSSGVITDSAAAGTALATGYKTDNGIISQTPEGKALYTVLENARDKGKATGLVTTTRITHATPAVFAAHIDDRDNENAIAEQLVNADVNVFLEGSHMSYELDRDVKKEPSIAEMTKAALEILSKDQEGFFLMVEGGRIDHASHANDTPTTMTDMMAFDEAVKAALDFAKMDGNTLVIVTADHATGGLSIGMGEEQWAKPEVLFDVKGSVEEKIAPMLKEDSSAEAIKKIAAEYMGITDLTDEEIAAIQVNATAGVMVRIGANIKEGDHLAALLVSSDVVLV
ncbi:alkaline phosphatase [Acetomicrobium mobile]|jgi:alkaline phosphatase|uniref:alkaline phosphatase n=1 Tax=Acetomicrobium mobile TaxID=97477 RepID=UPI0026F1ED4A|nr:alkaline phosphatase [Acetomicrobium mobile]